MSGGITSGKVYEQLLEKEDPAVVLQMLTCELDNLRREAVPEFENKARELVLALSQQVGAENLVATLTSQISAVILHSRENPKEIIDKMEEIINLLLSMPPQQPIVSKPVVSIISEDEAVTTLNDSQTRQYEAKKKIIVDGRLAMHSSMPFVYDLRSEISFWNQISRKVFEAIAIEYQQAGYQVFFNPTVEEPKEMVIVSPGYNGKNSPEYSEILQLRQENEDLTRENSRIKNNSEDLTKENATLKSKISRLEATMVKKDRTSKNIEIVDAKEAGEKLTSKQQSELESYCDQINQFINVNWSRGQEYLSMALKVKLLDLEVLKVFIFIEEHFRVAKWGVGLTGCSSMFSVNIWKLKDKTKDSTTRRS